MTGDRRKDPVTEAAALIASGPAGQTLTQLRSALTDMLGIHSRACKLIGQLKVERDDLQTTAEVRKTETLTIIMAKAMEVNRLLDEMDQLRKDRSALLEGVRLFWGDHRWDATRALEWKRVHGKMVRSADGEQSP